MTAIVKQSQYVCLQLTDCVYSAVIGQLRSKRLLKFKLFPLKVAVKYGKDPRIYNILCKEFIGDENGNVTGIKAVEIKWVKVSYEHKSNAGIVLVGLSMSLCVVACWPGEGPRGHVSLGNDFLGALNRESDILTYFMRSEGAPFFSIMKVPL